MTHARPVIRVKVNVNRVGIVQGSQLLAVDHVAPGDVARNDVVRQYLVEQDCIVHNVIERVLGQRLPRSVVRREDRPRPWRWPMNQVKRIGESGRADLSHRAVYLER